MKTAKLPKGVVHSINFNNTIVTITNLKGELFLGHLQGAAGLKGS
jgi:ribosomal protein S11